MPKKKVRTRWHYEFETSLGGIRKTHKLIAHNYDEAYRKLKRKGYPNWSVKVALRLSTVKQRKKKR